MHQGTDHELKYLYENWIAAGENWYKSTCYLNIRSASGTVRKGVYAWFSRHQLVQRYGETDADAIIDAILTGAPENAREMPGCVAVWASLLLVCVPPQVKQYWALDSEAEETRKEDWIERLYRAVEESDSESSSSSLHCKGKIKRSRKHSRKQSKSASRGRSARPRGRAGESQGRRGKSQSPKRRQPRQPMVPKQKGAKKAGINGLKMFQRVRYVQWLSLPFLLKSGLGPSVQEDPGRAGDEGVVSSRLWKHVMASTVFVTSHWCPGARKCASALSMTCRRMCRTCCLVDSVQMRAQDMQKMRSLLQEKVDANQALRAQTVDLCFWLGRAD